MSQPHSGSIQVCHATEYEGAGPNMDDPFSLLELGNVVSKSRQKDPAAVAANSLLCAAAAMAATTLDPFSSAISSAYNAINTTVRLSQVGCGHRCVIH